MAGKNKGKRQKSKGNQRKGVEAIIKGAEIFQLKNMFVTRRRKQK